MKEENDSMKQIEQFKLRIKEKGIINQNLLEYLGISANEIKQKTKKERKTEEIYQILQKNNILANKCEFRDFLKTISHLWEMHQSKKEIKYKIESLFDILKEDMKNIFSENELFLVFRFCRNKYILLILLEQNIISIETMIKNINCEEYYKNWSIIKYFYTEIRKYDEKYINHLKIMDKINGFKKFVEENDQNLELFYEIRKEGEKEPKIVELIREDKIEEFISFIEHYPIDLKAKIEKEDTIFGTNTEELTPIEYSALFGSVAIFKYLYLKNENIKIILEDYSSNIIEYAIQGRSYEIIHLLEKREEIIEELNKNQQKYLDLSIKMHYNEIYEYLMINYNNDNQITERIIKLMIIYRNYRLFNQIIESNQIELKDRAIISNIFYDICINGNEEIVKILIRQPNLDINLKDDIFSLFILNDENEQENEKIIKIIFIVIGLNRKLQGNFILKLILLIWRILFYIWTSFHSACSEGHLEIVKILMNQPNLDINMKDEIFDYLSY